MSVTGISSSNFYATNNTQGTQNKFQQIQSEFQQLGQDLTAGNLTQAQQDFATLTQNLPGQQQANAASTASSNNPIAQAFATLSNDLQTGNLSAAQQDFSTLLQDLQQQQGAGGAHHHHHHSGGAGAPSGSSVQSNPISQLFTQLGQALQSGNLATAQQTYTTLQQDLQQYVPGFGSGSNGAPPSPGGTNVTV